MKDTQLLDSLMVQSQESYTGKNSAGTEDKSPEIPSYSSKDNVPSQQAEIYKQLPSVEKLTNSNVTEVVPQPGLSINWSPDGLIIKLSNSTSAFTTKTVIEEPQAELTNKVKLLEETIVSLTSKLDKLVELFSAQTEKQQYTLPEEQITSVKSEEGVEIEAITEQEPISDKTETKSKQTVLMPKDKTLYTVAVSTAQSNFPDITPEQLSTVIDNIYKSTYAKVYKTSPNEAYIFEES